MGTTLQLTKQVREANLVEEDADGNATRVAHVYVYGFDGLVTVIDGERVKLSDRAEIVSTAADHTRSILEGHLVSVETTSNEYQVQIPNTGFRPEADWNVLTAKGLLAIYHDEQRDLADYLTALRAKQYRASGKFWTDGGDQH